jgi:hypothetical protein
MGWDVRFGCPSRSCVYDLKCCNSSQRFVGPDGRKYKWQVESTKPNVCVYHFRSCNLDLTVHQLVLDDVENTPVAVFHNRRLGVFSKARKASLEIAQWVPEETLDVIITTFIFLEKQRRNEVHSSGLARGGGAGSSW